MTGAGALRSTAPVRVAAKLARATVDAIARLGLPHVKPHVIRVLPHDEWVFTQGLACWRGLLFESAAGEASSTLRCIDLRDGRVRRVVPIPGDYAEGIAVIGDRLYQVSWKSGRARIFDLPDMELVGHATYQGEGWGLTAGGPAGLIMSDGSSTVRFLREDFGIAATRRIHSRGLPVRALNDLECVGDLLYANVLGRSELVEIALDTGKATRLIDCSPLVAAAQPPAAHSVLNGVAYQESTNSFFLTGKNWGMLFEVSIA